MGAFLSEKPPLINLSLYHYKWFLSALKCYYSSDQLVHLLLEYTPLIDNAQIKLAF